MKKFDGKEFYKGILIFMAIAFIATLLLTKLFWDWIIPDLLPGLVTQGLLTGTMSWLTALKIAVISAVMIGLKKTKRYYHMKKYHEYKKK